MKRWSSIVSSEDMQQVVKVMVKLLIATLAEQGMTQTQPSALKLLATKGYDPEMGVAHCVVSCRPKWKIN